MYTYIYPISSIYPIIYTHKLAAFPTVSPHETAHALTRNIRINIYIYIYVTYVYIYIYIYMCRGTNM